ncbi:MAG: right-handed parallel beta-helix repeat-containing protein [Anaerolineales bacterium]|nr:right-handed parallel beta-helix repeat-containing protein [Anaerolineales bacterium]
MLIKTIVPRVCLRKLEFFLAASLVLLLATGCGGGGIFTVNHSGDAGDSSPGDGYCRTGTSLTECTLRAAMEEANALAGAQTILFNLPAHDQTIYPLKPLPEITETVTIDGTSQPEFDGGKPVVRVDGSSLLAVVSGFKIADGINAVIKGLQISRFQLHGIENLGNLTLDHLEVAVNQASGIDSFTAAGGVSISLENSTVFENTGPGVNGINTVFTMDYVTMDRNTGGGLRVVGGSLTLDHGGVADNAVPTDGGGIYLSMAGNPDIRNTTIEGNTGGHKGGGLYLWGLPGTMMILTNCTFDGNYGYDGGGMYIDAGTSHLAASTLINNRAKHHGGGIFVNTNNNPTLWIEDGTVVGRIGAGNIANSAPASGGLGGGIYSMNNLYITDSSIEGNTGDGIYNEGGEVRVMDSSVSANTLSGIESFVSGATVDILITRSKFVKNGFSGIGAINADLEINQGSIRDNAASGIRMNGGTLTMDQSEVVGNHSSGDGGGIAGYNISAAMQNSTVSGNTAAATGGGLYLWGLAAGKISLANMTVSGNTAGTAGGGLEVGNGNVGLSNVTVAANTGGGVHVQNPSLVALRNTIVADHTAGNCGGLPVTSQGNNLDTDGTCALAGPGDLSGLPANLGPLADNGGPTFTHALLPGSPALETGDDATCMAADQRGIGRPQGLHCDMGAFEAESPSTATPPAVTITPTPTLTPTAAAIKFDPVNFSTDLIYTKIGRACKPKEVTIEVRISPEQSVQSVGLFYRLEEKEGANVTDWGGGLAMIPQGGGWYKLTVFSEDFPDVSKLNGDLWLAVQFVANGPDGQILVRSAVYRQVTVGQCKQ